MNQHDIFVSSCIKNSQVQFYGTNKWKITLLTHFCTLDSKCWAENKKHAKETASKTWTKAEKSHKWTCFVVSSQCISGDKAKGKISVPPISVIFNFSCRKTRAAMEAITGFTKLSTIAWDKGNIWML